MAVTANQLAVALFDAAVGGYKDTVDAFIYAQGEVSAAEMMLRESGLASNPDNSVFAYLVVAKMTGDTLTEAQKEAAADILVGWLAAGQSRGQVVLAAIDYLMSEAAAADATYGNAAMRFQNKVTAADNYAGNSTDVATLIAVLAGVTEDPATIDTAAQGDTFVLTTISETVVGTIGNDVIKGIFGDDAAVSHSTTYGAGDDIDGGTGTDTLQLTAVDNADPSATISVKNVETIDITDLHGAEFTATLVENAPAINFIGTLAGNESSVTDADLASVIGLSGKGDLTVDYASSTTSALTDAAAISLAGAGTSATVRSTVDVADGNTIDSLSIATSGTNYVSLVAGTAAKTVTITGNGTNDIEVGDLGDVAAVVTIDASASTGTNTIDIGSGLNTTDVVKGGTGADTLVANLTLATLVKPTLTGVETFKVDFDSAATLDLSAATGLTTVTLNGSSTNQLINKAQESVTTLNVTSQADADNDLTFSYDSASKGDLALNIGSTASTAANITLDAVTITNSTSLAVNTVGTKVYDVASLDINGAQTEVSVTVGASADLTIGGINGNGDIDAYSVDVAAGATFSGGLYLVDGDSVGDMTFNVAEDGELRAWNEISGGGSVGNVTVNAVGDNAFFSGTVNVLASGAGEMGDITLAADGDGAEIWFHATVSGGGDIGDISVTAENGATVDFSVSANSQWSGYSDAEGAGNVGDITIAIGADSSVSGYVAASGGSIGDVTVTLDGANASGALGLYATYMSGDLGDGEQYVAGGDVGNITLTIVEGNSFTIDAQASGGDIGNVVLDLDGAASGYVYLNATVDGEDGDHGGNVGTIDVTAADDTSFGITLAAELDVGAITVTGTDGVSGWIEVSGGASDDTAMLGDITVTLGDDSSFELNVSGYTGTTGNFDVTMGDGASAGLHFVSGEGDVGNIVVNVGDMSSVDIDFVGQSGGTTIGDISVVAGDNSDIDVSFSGASGAIGDIDLQAGVESDIYLNFSGGNNDGIGSITITGGDDNSSAEVYAAAGTVDGGFGEVDASAWLGDITIDLSAVTTGTAITVGADGSDVIGTTGSDNIFLGAGVDTVQLMSASALDEIFSFQKAKDIIDVSDFVAGAETAVADNAAAAAIVTGTAYVFADGSNTTTGETIADFEDLTDVAAFLDAAFSGAEAGGEHVMAIINDGGTSAYVYDVVLADDGVAAAEVTLVGVVNADGALTVANVFAS